jgi:hypothetical protein
MIFIVKCVKITHFFIPHAALWWKSMIFIVLWSLEAVHDTLQYSYCIFSLLYHLLRIRLKHQKPLLSYIWEREKVHCKCTMQCTVHCGITLFNVGNVLLCVIYQLNFTIFMCVTRMSHIYIYRSVLSVVSRKHGRSWNVLSTDTRVHLYIFKQ